MNNEHRILDEFGIGLENKYKFPYINDLSEDKIRSLVTDFSYAYFKIETQNLLSDNNHILTQIQRQLFIDVAIGKSRIHSLIQLLPESASLIRITENQIRSLFALLNNKACTELTMIFLGLRQIINDKKK